MGAKANANGKAPLPAKGKKPAKPEPAMKSSGSAKAGPAIKVVPSLKPAAKAAGRSVAVLPEPARPPMDELAALWAEFKGTASPQARERLILHYAPLVKYVASRVATGLPASVSRPISSPTGCSD